MLYCNPRDDNVLESPALGTCLAAKFDSAQSNPGSKNSTISENSVQPPKIGITAGSVLKGSSLKGFEVSCEATTATDHLKTPQKTHSNPIMTPSPRVWNLVETFHQREVRFNEGYDSEGELGPISYVVKIEEKQYFKEEALPQQRKDPLAGSDLLGPSHTDTSNAAVKEPKNPRQHQPNKKQTRTRLEQKQSPKKTKRMD